MIEKRIAEFEKMAFGMFIHWGLYSQLDKGEWIRHNENLDTVKYNKLLSSFTAKDFDAEEIARLAQDSGMKYITLTTRHHEGFSLYDTRGLSEFDSMHSPAGRDLIAEFTDACRKYGIVPMLYHTTLDWFHPDFTGDFDSYLEYLRKSVEILCTHYGKIGGLWFDGNWSKPDADWKLDELYGTIRRLQPEAMIINNTGLDARGVLSHPEIDSVTFEQGLPHALDFEGKHIASEMCQTLNEHWGVACYDFNYKSVAEIIENLCLCRKAGSNYLLNIGLGAQGKVPKIQQAMLEIVGDWMGLFGEAVRDGQSANIKSQCKDFILKAENGDMFAFIFDLKIKGNIHVTVDLTDNGLRAFSGVTSPVKSIRWIDSNENLSFCHNPEEGLLCLNATGFDYGCNTVVRVAKIEM